MRKTIRDISLQLIDERRATAQIDAQEALAKKSEGDIHSYSPEPGQARDLLGLLSELLQYAHHCMIYLFLFFHSALELRDGISLEDVYIRNLMSDLDFHSRRARNDSIGAYLDPIRARKKPRSAVEITGVFPSSSVHPCRRSSARR